jgi:crossover junction endonuclease MUS81
MNIIIDCKENKKFIDVLYNYQINFTVQSLDLGDIVFTYHEKNILYIERKTINDLAASLNDGRYHEQKARLKGKNALYLIEGSYEDLDLKYNKTFNLEKLKGCIINTMVRDNINVYLTKNMNESAIFIADIAKRLPKYANLLIKNDNHFENITSNDLTYSNSLKSKKKDNMNTTVCFINQLHQIPGVSINMAQNIVDQYLSMSNLISKYNETEDKEGMLKDIKINNRKLGPVVSKRVYEYLFKLF